MINKISTLLLIIILIFSFNLWGCKETKTTSETAAGTQLEEGTAEEVAEEEQTGEKTGEAAEEIKPQAPEGEVTFITEDGIEINGNIFGTGNKWVILSHMFGSSQAAWYYFAQYLVDNGYIVLTYDFRGYGKSGGSRDTSEILNMDKDLESALNFIKQYDAEKIFLTGASMGGTISLVVASKQTIDGVISISSPAEMGDLSALDAVVNIDAPKFFIVSRQDQPYAGDAEALYQASPEPKSIKILEGKNHGTNIFDGTENSEIAKQIILDFLNSI